MKSAYDMLDRERLGCRGDSWPSSEYSRHKRCGDTGETWDSGKSPDRHRRLGCVSEMIHWHCCWPWLSHPISTFRRQFPGSFSADWGSVTESDLLSEQLKTKDFF